MISFNLTNSSVEDVEIGGLAFFLVYISECLPYVVLIALGEIVGVIGNLIILGTIVFNKELRTPTYFLVFNLALADLVVTGLIDSFILAGVFIGQEYFRQLPNFCQFIGAICLVSCISSLMSLGFLALNRYIHICHHGVFNAIFPKQLVIFYCGITWVIGALIQIPNLTGWGGYYYDPKTLNCVWNREASHSYSLFFPLTCIVTPCVAILFCYVKIFIYSYRSKSQLRKHAGKNSSSMHGHQASIRLARGLFAAFVSFTVCWLPYGLIVMADYQNQLPRPAYMFAVAVAHLNSSLNFFLYAIFNSSFRHGYKVFFKKLLFVVSHSPLGASVSSLELSQHTHDNHHHHHHADQHCFHESKI